MGKRLSLMDSSWFQMETSDVPMHVGALMLFKIPEDAPDTYMQDLVERARQPGELGPLFKKRLNKHKGFTLSWMDDANVDLEYHVRHLALPAPGRVRELLSIVSHLHGQTLDRHRPLWECYFIEGLEDNRFALYFKIHHGLIDGVGGMRTMQASMSEDPAEMRAPPWAKAAMAQKKPSGNRKKPSAVALLKEQVGSLPGVARGLQQTFMNKAAAAPYQAPYSLFNTRISSARRLAAQSYDIERIREIGKAYGGTINDVVMAMCAACTRDYLIDQNALPNKPLIANVPASVRPADAETSGNAFTVLLANLGTHIADPVERFFFVKDSMQAAKDRLSTMSATEIMNYTALVNAPFSLGQLTGLSGNSRMPPAYNLIISNVPGPKNKVYYQGAEMLGMYPVSLPFNGYGLNITLTSYCDSLDFGLIGCRETLPKLQRMLDYLSNSLDDLEKNRPSQAV